MPPANQNQLLTDDELDLVKRQLTGVMMRMSRMQVFELADFLYEEARYRRSSNRRDDWRDDWQHEITV